MTHLRGLHGQRSTDLSESEATEVREENEIIMATTSQPGPRIGKDFPKAAAATPSTELLNQSEAAALLNVPARTLERWRYEGTGPEYVKLGHGKRGGVRYHKRALLEYIRKRTHVPSVRAAGE